MEVYRIKYVADEGVQNALVFSKPTEGKVFQRVLRINADGTTSYSAPSVPHREPADYGPEGGGHTWHFAT